MPLSNKDLSDIAKEFSVAKSDMNDNKNAIPSIEEQILKKDDQTDRVYILYNNAHLERVNPYEIEHRWIDGTTYSTITQSQVETFGSDGRVSYFFPLSWGKSNPKLQDNGNGNPRTISSNSESYVLNSSLENYGLLTLINLLKNGIAGVASTLTESPLADIPAGDIENVVINVDSTSNFNIGDFIYINKDSSSGLYKITSVAVSTLTISSIIPSAIGFSGVNSIITNNILGFSNTERQNLLSSTYQELLINLTNKIKNIASLWDVALNNQLTQLNINIDAPNQIITAKNYVNSAKSSYNTWNSLADTGVLGKFVDSSLSNLEAAYNTRNSWLAFRVSDITTALGSISQDSEGFLSGEGLYLQRYKCLGFLINTANGPLHASNSLKNVKTDYQNKIINDADKLATFSNVVSFGAGVKDPTLNTLEIEGISQFSVSDTVILTANDLASIECTITAISGNIVTLSVTIPKEYTKASKVSIIKQV